MSKINKHKKNKILGGFVVLEKMLLLQSKPWKNLSCSARCVYIFIRSKKIGFLDVIVGEAIKVPYSIIVEETGLARQTVRNAIIQLENMGFIDLLEQGGLKSGGYSMNTYALSKRFSCYGTSMFKKGVLKKNSNFNDKGFAVLWKKQKTSINIRPEESKN